jgi:hypothetical protein
MSTISENIEAAVANAAEKIANTDSIDEAETWQRIINNLVAALQQTRHYEHNLVEPVEVVAVEEPTEEESEE